MDQTLSTVITASIYLTNKEKKENTVLYFYIQYILRHYACGKPQWRLSDMNAECNKK